MRCRSILLPALVSLIAIPAGARAQLREPTADEARVLTPVIAAIGHVFDQFASPDWAKSKDLYDGHPLVNAGRYVGVPIDINQDFERVYQVPVASQRMQTMLLPMIQRAQQRNDMAALVRAGREVQRLSHVTLDAYVNRHNVDLGRTGEYRAVQVPGVPVAYQEQISDSTATHYVLLFGNWAGVHVDPRTHWLHYDFAHAPGTPYVDNVVIYVYGADDRVQEMLRTADWPSITAALSH